MELNLAKNQKMAAMGRKGGLATAEKKFVDVKILQKAFKASGLTASELARRLEWYSADASRVRRTLGITKTMQGGMNKGKPPYTAKRVGRRQAAEIIEALEVDPTDYDF